MKPSEILTALLKLFSIKKRWAQGYYAYDRNHQQVSPGDASATCFCLVGGLSKVSPGHQWDLDREAKRYLSLAVRNDPVCFNDAPGRTVQEVRAAIKAARKLALKDGV